MKNVDRWGIILSIGCIIHCTIMPFLLALIPAIGSTVLEIDDTLHKIIAIPIITIGLAAFIPGYLSHRKTSIVLIALAGMVLVVSGVYFEGFDIILTSSGGSLLTMAHLLNHKYKCDHKHHKE